MQLIPPPEAGRSMLLWLLQSFLMLLWSAAAAAWKMLHIKSVLLPGCHTLGAILKKSAWGLGCLRCPMLARLAEAFAVSDACKLGRGRVVLECELELLLENAMR